MVQANCNCTPNQPEKFPQTILKLLGFAMFPKRCFSQVPKANKTKTKKIPSLHHVTCKEGVCFWHGNLFCAFASNQWSQGRMTMSLRHLHARCKGCCPLAAGYPSGKNVFACFWDSKRNENKKNPRKPWQRNSRKPLKTQEKP